LRAAVIGGKSDSSIAAPTAAGDLGMPGRRADTMSCETRFFAGAKPVD